MIVFVNKFKNLINLNSDNLKNIAIFVNLFESPNMISFLCHNMGLFLKIQNLQQIKFCFVYYLN